MALYSQKTSECLLLSEEQFFLALYLSRLSNTKYPQHNKLCDGSFAHWKAKIKLHRGLSKERRKKDDSLLLGELLKTTPFF